LNNNGSNLPRRLLATGLATCAHLVVLLLLGWKVPRLVVAAPGPEAGVMEIALMRPPQRPRPRPAAKPARSAPSAPAPAPRVLTAPTPGAPTLIAPIPSTPAPATPNADSNLGEDHVRDALRGLTGCSDPSAYRLSHEERAKCDQRLAAAKPAPIGSQLSAEEMAQFDPPKQPPIFVRKPHNGCLPRVGDTPSPVGSNAQTTTFGLACGWSF
jgi:hypothetical protein